MVNLFDKFDPAEYDKIELVWSIPPIDTNLLLGLDYNHVYRIINNVNEKYYIGVHTKKLDDYYLGSGDLIRSAVKKYGPENFTKEILIIAESEDEAYEYESQIVTQELVDDPNCYNIALGGKGGWARCKERSVIDKRVETNKANHGGVLSMNTEDAKQTKIEKYGSVTGAMMTEDAQNKAKEHAKATMIDRYGSVDYFLRLPENIEKAKKRIKELYPDQHPSQTPEVKARRIATNIDKYGSANGAMMTEDANSKRKNTLLEKYGTLCFASKDPESIKKRVNSLKKHRYYYFNGDLVYKGIRIAAKRKMNKLKQKWIESDYELSTDNLKQYE